MTDTITIKDLKRGEKAEVTGFNDNGTGMEQDLREIGFSEGDEVEVMAFGAFGATPVSVRLNRTLIALRSSEAAMIGVLRR